MKTKHDHVKNINKTLQLFLKLAFQLKGEIYPFVLHPSTNMDCDKPWHAMYAYKQVYIIINCIIQASSEYPFPPWKANILKHTNKTKG